ncbi:class I SAM-dependent methyltransferase [Xinfangfangia sp. D13-10-4-6]|uniref:class I SAM-dependent methyltransferase n=1 Tax=Pseudogemmobacter hezensis TaxID=2737662 RepID=UPI001553039C|nr:SAM-dependent methyltransferase [Pseudogemmobacter hezensis]NPD17099.1 class I SAM-dependent methyltransferase [Pseudogemmobacter hezensis]
MTPTPLAGLLAARIRATGPISLADYMAECLLHPAHGYYATRDPFGQAGDFITAPEISQMFGELLGLCLAQYWLDLGQPASFTLAECGPGRGTLMADILRATARVPGFHAAARIILVEASETLREVQARTLAAHSVEWRPQVQDLPEAPLFLVANEFFDALPIRQFTARAGLWAETMIGLSPEGQLQPGQAPPGPLAALAHRADVPEGGVVEICPAAAPITAEIAGRIRRCGGLALILDYGGWRSLGDTFQAMAQSMGKHAYTDPFAAPGEADLTAHVDFEALAQAARPAATAYTTQGTLLKALGIDTRARQLAAHPRAAANDPLAAARRLTDPAEMGTLFKALAIYRADAPLPAGFDTSGSDRDQAVQGSDTETADDA